MKVPSNYRPYKLTSDFAELSSLDLPSLEGTLPSAPPAPSSEEESIPPERIPVNQRIKKIAGIALIAIGAIFLLAASGFLIAGIGGFAPGLALWEPCLGVGVSAILAGIHLIQMSRDGATESGGTFSLKFGPATYTTAPMGPAAK